MKLIIKEVYSNFRVDKNSKAIFVGMLQGVLEGQQLDTLDYFVVTDPEAGEFEKAVSKYAAIVGTEANVTRDGSYRAEGKTLSGLGNDGRLHQTIIITSAICRQAIMEVAFMLGYLNMDEKTIHEKQLEQLYSVHLIVHEIGHAVDYENRYRMFGTVNTKSFYNLGNERERQEYFLENAFSLWGEYYAETFSFKNFNKTPNKNEGNLLWCIDSYFENQVNFYLERAYRILYFFVLSMASVTVSAQPSMTSYPPTRSAAKPPSPTTTRTVIHGQATGRRCWPSLQYIPTSTLIATLSLSMPPKCSASKTPFGLCTKSPTRLKK